MGLSKLETASANANILSARIFIEGKFPRWIVFVAGQRDAHGTLGSRVIIWKCPFQSLFLSHGRRHHATFSCDDFHYYDNLPVSSRWMEKYGECYSFFGSF